MVALRKAVAYQLYWAIKHCLMLQVTIVVVIVTVTRSPKVLFTDRGNMIDQRDAYPVRKVSKSWYQQQCLDKTVIHSYIAT